jgi:3-oxoacyl-[acyl-carrier protein] reductase
MDLTLQNKHALVCGSTQGIGKAVAMELAALGATVILLARNAEKLMEVVSELPVLDNQQHGFIVADFSQPAAVRSAVDAFMQSYGSPIHILVNNTGGPAGGPIADANADAFEQAFQTHLINNHYLAQALLSGMKSIGYGRIINIISTSVKAPLPNLGVSNTIRGAVANWAKTLANEVARWNITVNNVLPGATETGRLISILEAKSKKAGITDTEAKNHMQSEIPMGRFARPEEIAYAVAFLASPAAAYITGINLPVDGGRTPNL